MKRLLFLFLPMLCAALSANASDEARLLRFPAMHGNQIVFTYGGDLYTVNATGGLARRLTSDAAGYEIFARFSPDGKNLAFTGQYDGNTEVYVMPANGGTPKRITYTATLGRDDISDRMGPNNIVMTWRDNQTVIFRSRKQEFNSFKGQLFEATLSASIPKQLPFSTGGWCSYEPNGKRLAFNKVMREFRTWKYYKGGMADDVWIYDPADNSIVNITNNDAQDIYPMWHGQKVYFLSDRDRIMNLFVYDFATKTTTKVTNFTDYDIKFPSLGDEAIVFEKGGYIWTYNLQNGQLNQINIELADDGDVRPVVTKDASKNINSWDLSPDGKRALFGARGDVFTVPVKNGITRNLTQSSGANDRNIGWSPDGKTIAFISDRTGEDEIYIMPEAGGEAIKITSGSDTWKYDILWSPDSKKIAWGDKMNRLQFVDVDTKKVTLVAQTPDGELRDIAWSPDSRWIAYSFPIYNSSSVIRAYNLQSGKSQDVTSSWYEAGSPSFSPDGKYLYFSSSRDFNPSYSWTEWNHIYTDMNKVYMVPLAKATPSPFAYENDEVTVKSETAEKKDDKTADKGKDKKVEEPAGVKVEIDFDGIEERALAISSKPAAYWGVIAVNDGVYYTRSATGEDQPTMVYWDVKSKKESEIG
ncbi:MAG: protease, partial [Bacteroidetes bacterium HGW-Bacteroidetes-22]